MVKPGLEISAGNELKLWVFLCVVEIRLSCIKRKKYMTENPCFLPNRPLGHFGLVVAMSVPDWDVCPLPMLFFSRLLIGQHRSHDHCPGLSLVTAPGVKIGCINRTIFVLEHSILTLGALLTYSCHMITSQASHWSQHRGSKMGATTQHFLCWSTPFWPLVHS